MFMLTNQTRAERRIISLYNMQISYLHIFQQLFLINYTYIFRQWWSMWRGITSVDSGCGSPIPTKLKE